VSLIFDNPSSKQIHFQLAIDSVLQACWLKKQVLHNWFMLCCNILAIFSHLTYCIYSSIMHKIVY